MTEDEAFIRTIVDRPGDDLPRLVYADWLDERDDPRGVYLRAEAEWAKAKQTAGFIVLRLNELAEGLDPVWVARVSRPPVGVCCDHLQFTNCGPRGLLSEIHEYERRVGFGLPDAFRVFLANYNAGHVVPIGPVPEQPPTVEGSPAICFSALRHSYNTLHDAIPELSEGRGVYVDLGFAKIGYNASDLTTLLIGITTENLGLVCVDCAIKPELLFGNTIDDSSTTLPEFFASIQPKWVPARESPFDI